jgi:uncharacterized delta-60 repeat protein
MLSVLESHPARAGPADVLRMSGADGTADTTFGSNGVVRVDFSAGGVVSSTFSDGLWDEASKLVVQTDGKIIIGGFTQVAGVFRYAPVRLLSDGSLDTTFGVNGLLSTPFTTQNDLARSIALQDDGKIVVAGQLANLSSKSDIGIARYTNAGVREPTDERWFSPAGYGPSSIPEKQEPDFPVTLKYC